MATSCLTDQAPATLPNEQDLREAQKELSAVCGSLVTLQWRMQRIARADRIDDYPEYALSDGDEIPTFAHIGELYSFALDARSRLEEAEEYLNGFEKHLRDLDTVRQMARDLQVCRDCGETFPFDPDADRCEKCAPRDGGGADA